MQSYKCTPKSSFPAFLHICSHKVTGFPMKSGIQFCLLVALSCRYSECVPFLPLANVCLPCVGKHMLSHRLDAWHVSISPINGFNQAFIIRWLQSCALALSLSQSHQHTHTHTHTVIHFVHSVANGSLLNN